MHNSTVVMQLCRTREEKLEEVYGKHCTPAAIQRYCAGSGKPPPRLLNDIWAPTMRSRGLFLDFVTMAQGERGAYVSPQCKAQRIATAIVFYLVDKIGGLPALAARMQAHGAENILSARADLDNFCGHFASGVSGSCGTFVQEIVRDTVRTSAHLVMHQLHPL